MRSNRHRRALYGVLLPVIVVAGCDRTSEVDRETGASPAGPTHEQSGQGPPRTQSEPPAPPVSVDPVRLDPPEVRLDLGDAPPIAAPLLPGGTRAVEPPLRVGALDGTPEEVFGKISDVGVDPEGRVVVVDERVLEVKLYDAWGMLLDRIGRPGDGPGEFRMLERVAVGPGGDVFALDPANRRVTVFSVGAGGGFSLRRTVPLPLVATDLCLSGERLFVAGVHDGRIVHELSPEGRVLRSFGAAHRVPPDQRDMLAWDETLSEGYLACSESSGRIVFAARNRPEVRAYTAAGAPLWTRRFADWSQLGAEKIPGGWRMAFDPRTGGVDQVVAAVTTGDRLLVQSVHLTPGVDPDEAEVTTRVLALSDGREIHRTDALPRLGAVRLGVHYGYRNLPFPELLIFESLEIRDDAR